MINSRSMRTAGIIISFFLFSSCEFLLDLAVEQAGGHVLVEADYHDGSNENPVQLTLDQEYSGRISPYGGSYSISYYSFFSANMGYYRVKITNCSINPEYLKLSFKETQSARISDSVMGSLPLDLAMYAGQRLFIQVTNDSDSQASYKISVTWIGTLPNEGSPIDPIELALGTAHAGKVGTTSNWCPISYYYFTVSEAAGVYDVLTSSFDPASPSITHALYTKPDFSNCIESTNSPSGLTYLSLTAGTYYLTIQNNSSSNETYTIVAREHAPFNDGSVASPVPLSLDTPYAGKVGPYSDPVERNSYYSFIVPSTGDYDFTISDKNPAAAFTYISIGIDSSFTNYNYSSYGNYIHKVFDSGTTYYVRVNNYDNTSTGITYSLLLEAHVPLNEGSVSNPVPVTFEVPHAGKAGPYYESIDRYSYYSFTVPNTGDYDFAISDKNPASGSLYLYIGMDSSFTNYDYSTSSGNIHRVFSSGTTYYAKVDNNASTSMTYSLLLKAHVPQNEGSVISPVPLTFETPHAGQVGPYPDSIDRYSYYSFTVPSTGDYDFTISDQNPAAAYISISIGMDSNFTIYDYVSTNGYIHGVFSSSTTYYARVYNNGSNAMIITYSILLKTHVPQNEGSAGNPVPLTLETTYAGKAGPGSDSIDRFSYYSFTITTSGGYDVLISDKNPTTANSIIYIGTDSSFTIYDYSTSNNTIQRVFNSGTTYYLRLSNPTSTSITYSITIKTHVPMNEGSVDNPVELQAGTPRAGQAGPSSDSIERYSYYYFTVPSTGAYDMVADSTATPPDQYTLYLGTNSSFNSYTYSATKMISNCSLTAGTTYYLRFASSYSTSITYTILVRAHVPANEGSMDIPVVLSLGIPHPGTLGASTDPIERSSYYTFTTDTAGRYIITVSDFNPSSHNTGYYFYSDGGFVNQINYSSVDSGFISPLLNAATTYYLKAYNFSSVLTYTITVTKE